MGAGPGTEARQASQKVKYLLSFTDYVEWPERAFASSEAPLVIGIIGEDPFGDTLDQQAKEFRGRRRIEVRRFKGMQEFRESDLPGPRENALAAKQRRKDAELRACHVLYVSRSEDAFLSTILRKVRGASVLTVGDRPSFARRGGVIGFFTTESDVQLRFEINLAAAEAAKLNISSRLLALAKVLRERDASAQP